MKKCKKIMPPVFDFFLSYGSEEDHEIIGPVIMAFKLSRLTCFIDFEQMHTAENIAGVSNYGLMNSRRVLAIITENYINKPWAMNELQAVLHERTPTGQSKLIPVIAGTTSEKESIIETIPLLRRLDYIEWRYNPYGIMLELQWRILQAPSPSAYRHT